MGKIKQERKKIKIKIKEKKGNKKKTKIGKWRENEGADRVSGEREKGEK